jgi:hypothetical protein
MVDPFGRGISLTELECRLRGREVRYLSTSPPEFSREWSLPEAKYVVVELAIEEPPGQLCTRTGDDLLPRLTQAEALLFPPA